MMNTPRIAFGILKLVHLVSHGSFPPKAFKNSHNVNEFNFSKNRPNIKRNPLPSLVLAVIAVMSLLTGSAWSSPSAPQGLYMIAPPSGIPAEIPNFVSGYTLRIRWTDLESTQGTYNFEPIAATIANLQQRNLHLNLELLAAFAPEYVIHGATNTFVFSMGNRSASAPLPWDSYALSRWATLMRALAAYPIYDAISKTKVPLCKHPTLVSIEAPIVGLQGIRDQHGWVTGSANYNRQNFIKAVIDNVSASRIVFPEKFGFLAFFRMNDTVPNPPLDQALFRELHDSFMQPGQLGLGLFQELWSDEGPEPQFMGRYLRQLQPPNGMMLQALTSWSHPFTATAPMSQRMNKIASGTPEQGLEYITSNYPTGRYFELYANDLLNPAFAPIFEKWAPRLIGER
jgi:hypothetical protein